MKTKELAWAIKEAIKWGEELYKEKAFEANLYCRGVDNPVNENAWKRRKRINLALEVLREWIEKNS